MWRFAIGVWSITAIVAFPGVSQSRDLLDLLEQDVRERMEDSMRRRARDRQAEIEAEKSKALKSKALPDLSQYGTPVERPIRPRQQHQPASGIDCITIDLTDEARATYCF